MNGSRQLTVFSKAWGRISRGAGGGGSKAMVREHHEQAAAAASGVPSTLVTRKNIAGLLDGIRRDVEEADFVALDAGLTGLHSAPWRACHALDTCETWYHKLKDSVKRFAMLQLGLCTFKWIESECKYHAHPYNFLLFPREEGNSFLCQTANLELLADQGLDLNACIQHGLSHMSKNQQTIAWKNMKFETEDYATMHLFAKFRDGPKRSTSHGDKLLFNQFRARLVHWHSTVEGNGCSHYLASASGVVDSSGGTNLSSYNGYPQFKDKDSMSDRLLTSSVIWLKTCESLPAMSTPMKWEALGHRELLVLLEVAKLYFNDLVIVVQPTGNLSTHKNVFVFYTASQEERVLLLEELEKKESRGRESQLTEAIGVHRVIDVIVDSRKPVVGHHCLFGFAHIYRSFIKGLPVTAAKFSAELHESFAFIFDVKYLVKHICDVKIDDDLSLSALYIKYFGKHGTGNAGIKVEIEDDALEDKSSRRFIELQQKQEVHDTATRAYMAGSLFVQVCALTSTEPSLIRHMSKVNASGAKSELERHVNKLCMNSVTASVLDLSTGTEIRGLKSPPFYSNVVLVWGYPSGTPLESLQASIINDLKFKHSMDVYPIDDSSAFIKFHCREVTEQFFTLVRKMPSSTSTKNNQLDGLKVSRFAGYEFVCKSSPSMDQLAECAIYLQIG